MANNELDALMKNVSNANPLAGTVQPQQSNGLGQLFSTANSPSSLEYLAKGNESSAPGLALFQRTLGAASADRENAASAEQKRLLITALADRVQKRDYAGAASVYSQLDPEGAKTLLPQLMGSDPNLQNQLEFAKTEGGLNAETQYGVNKRQLKLLDMQLEREKAVKEKEVKLTPFQEAAQKEQGKKYGDIQSGGIAADEQLTAIDDALSAFSAYKDKSAAGTGPIATLFGARKYVNEDLQNLDAKFNKIGLSSMVKLFQGMSKAVDSNSERKAFEATQPNIKNDDNVNAELLLGAKALALKAKMESQAQQAWANKEGNLDNYQSPVFGKMEALIAPNGEMELVQKDKIPNALKAGYTNLDEYAKVNLLNRKSSKPASPESIKTLPDGRKFKKVPGGWEVVE